MEPLETVVVTTYIAKKTSDFALKAIKLTGSFALGVANAWASNQVLGAGRTDAVKNGLTDSYGVAFQIGQKVGDAYSMVTGGGEVTGGVGGEIASVGIATPVAVPLAIHGATAFWNGLYHLVSGRIVYTNGVNDPSATQYTSPAKQPKYQDHHISTDKHTKEWTPKFKKIFDKAGLDISKAKENIVRVLNHQGPHPDEYHQYVYDLLLRATKGLRSKSAAYKNAVIKTLDSVGKDAQTPGSYVNKLITK